jgi:hypothetical protein
MHVCYVCMHAHIRFHSCVGIVSRARTSFDDLHVYMQARMPCIICMPLCVHCVNLSNRDHIHTWDTTSTHANSTHDHTSRSSRSCKISEQARRPSNTVSCSAQKVKTINNHTQTRPKSNMNRALMHVGGAKCLRGLCLRRQSLRRGSLARHRFGSRRCVD